MSNEFSADIHQSDNDQKKWYNLDNIVGFVKGCIAQQLCETIPLTYKRFESAIDSRLYHEEASTEANLSGFVAGQMMSAAQLIGALSYIAGSESKAAAVLAGVTATKFSIATVSSIAEIIYEKYKGNDHILQTLDSGWEV